MPRRFRLWRNRCLAVPEPPQISMGRMRRNGKRLIAFFAGFLFDAETSESQSVSSSSDRVFSRV